MSTNEEILNMVSGDALDDADEEFYAPQSTRSSGYLQREMKRAKEIEAKQSTETLAEAQVALEQAQASYARYPSDRKAYRIAAANDRVAAAECRSDDLVMAWVEAYALEINAVRKFAVANHNFQAGKCEYPRNLESVAYHAEQAAIQAWQAVENQRAGQRVVAQVEALTTAIPSLAEWAETPGGQEYMDLPPDVDLVKECAASGNEAAKLLLAGRHPGRTVQ